MLLVEPFTKFIYAVWRGVGIADGCIITKIYNKSEQVSVASYNES